MTLFLKLATYQEYLGFTAAALSAISFIPQVIKIWKLRSAKDISTCMYVIYTSGVVLWLIYGFIIKSAPIIFSQIFTLISVLTILFMKYLWK